MTNMILVNHGLNYFLSIPQEEEKMNGDYDTGKLNLHLDPHQTTQFGDVSIHNEWPSFHVNLTVSTQLDTFASVTHFLAVCHMPK